MAQHRIDPDKISIVLVPPEAPSYGGSGMETKQARFRLRHPTKRDSQHPLGFETTGEGYFTLHEAALAAARWASNYDPELVLLGRKLREATEAYVEREYSRILSRGYSEE